MNRNFTRSGGLQAGINYVQVMKIRRDDGYVTATVCTIIAGQQQYRHDDRYAHDPPYYVCGLCEKGTKIKALLREEPY